MGQGFIPMVPVVVPMSQEAIQQMREAVLVETIARLLRESLGSKQSETAAVVDLEAGAEEPAAPAAPAAAGETLPPWRQAAQGLALPPPPPEKVEAPLEKFIRVFGLDELAAKCLLKLSFERESSVFDLAVICFCCCSPYNFLVSCKPRKLQDDEAAFVIESCQHRLKYAKNPSAVVMIAIRGVANKVGRRYYGTAEVGRETATNEPNTSGELKIIGGFEELAADPYLEEEEEEEEEVDQEVELQAPPSKRARTEAPAAPSAAAAPAAPGAQQEEKLLVEVLGEAAAPEEKLVVEMLGDEAEDDADGLFFVDTGPA